MSLYRFLRDSALFALASKYRIRLYRIVAAIALGVITLWLYPDIGVYLSQESGERNMWAGTVLMGKTVVVYAAFIYALWQFRPEPASGDKPGLVRRLLAFAGRNGFKFFRIAVAVALAALVHWLYGDIADYFANNQYLLFALITKTIIVLVAFVYVLWQLRPGSWGAQKAASGGGTGTASASGSDMSSAPGFDTGSASGSDTGSASGSDMGSSSSDAAAAFGSATTDSTETGHSHVPLNQTQDTAGNYTSSAEEPSVNTANPLGFFQRAGRIPLTSWVRKGVNRSMEWAKQLPSAVKGVSQKFRQWRKKPAEQ
ncbi:MAG: hypothetical protein ACR2PR_08290 [Pseudohongiellaceae bacterium]